MGGNFYFVPVLCLERGNFLQSVLNTGRVSNISVVATSDDGEEVHADIQEEQEGQLRGQGRGEQGPVGRRHQEADGQDRARPVETGEQLEMPERLPGQDGVREAQVNKMTNRFFWISFSGCHSQYVLSC